MRPELHPWLAAVRPVLAAAGDAERAAGQAAYMKSAMPYHGLATPRLRQLLEPHLAAYAPLDRGTWEEDVRQVWDDATHREERYAALALARHRVSRGWQDAATLPLYRHLVGAALASDRAEATPVVRAWAGDDDLWLRRTAVLAQLRHRSDTDTSLLAEVVEANLDDRTFWLRKAIGWALREHARTDPGWVRDQVTAWDGRISGLSRREALKHL